MNRPFPGPYHSDGKFIHMRASDVDDRAGIIIAHVMGNAGVPAVAMTATLLAAAWDMQDELTKVLACGEYETPGGGRNCRFCDACMDHSGTFRDTHDKDCVIHGVRAALAKAEGRAP